MNANVAEPLKQLHNASAELASLAETAVASAADSNSDVVDRLKGTLSAVRQRIKDAEQVLKRDTVRGAEVAEQYIHDHAWLSIGVAAAAAFLLGALTARRD